MKDVPDLDTIDNAGEPFFALRRCEIRYNPPSREHGVALNFDPAEGSLVNGVLNFSGFTRQNGAVLGCHFRYDETLAPGTLAISPITASGETPERREGDA
jgi:hypothetical protein